MATLEIPALLRRIAALWVAVLACGWALPLHAAEDDVRLWTTGVVSGELRKGLRGSVAVQARFRDDVSDLERVVVSPSLTLSLTKGIGATLGYDAHFIDSPGDSIEHRAWQQLGAVQPLLGTDAQARFRLEERFIEGVGGAALRGRLLLGFKLPVAGSRWSFEAHNELFWNLTSHGGGGPDAGFDQNRLFVGFGRPLSASTRASLGYLLQYVDRDGRPDAANHALSIAVHFSP